MSDTLFTRRPVRIAGVLLTGLAAALASPAREASAQTDEGMTLVADGGAATIDAFGVCRVVQNMTGLDVMVPHSIPEEWYTGGEILPRERAGEHEHEPVPDDDRRGLL